ncbi:hypothetical protein CFter6_1526 [Collimonas fungivorans]|uniref:Uncharacterized protein n=1 Tax=Collimonas fungivorans TaxID=158899 RepID=A0A127P8T4_9BURK|nr:hypothetical protein CFter6_1526 [Collimonas fungivorans]
MIGKYCQILQHLLPGQGYGLIRFHQHVTLRYQNHKILNL